MKWMLLSAILLACPQSRVTDPEWTVVFTFKQPNVAEPATRIYVVVHAKSEGEAAIYAQKHMTEKLTTTATERLIYLEAQMKK